ncbi:hypothetical protein WJX82_005619 [Trebouxia sp. C0006]
MSGVCYQCTGTGCSRSCPEQAVYNLVNQVTLHMNHVNRFGVPFVTLIPWSRHTGCLLLRQSPAFVRPRFYRSMVLLWTYHEMYILTAERFSDFHEVVSAAKSREEQANDELLSSRKEHDMSVAQLKAVQLEVYYALVNFCEPSGHNE